MLDEGKQVVAGALSGFLEVCRVIKPSAYALSDAQCGLKSALR